MESLIFIMKECLKIVLTFQLDGVIYIAHYVEDGSTEFQCPSFDSFEDIRGLPVCDFEVKLCNKGLTCCLFQRELNKHHIGCGCCNNIQ